MGALATRLTGVLLIVVLLLAPLAVHLALETQHGIMLARVLVAVQAALVTWLALPCIGGPSIGGTSIAGRTLRAGACGVVFLGVLCLARLTPEGAVVAAAVPHAMAYLALLAVFAASLKPGREAVVTVLARRSRGRLPPKVIRYTRRVTWAWCGFFLAQIACSAMLLLFAPRYVWSLFILCNVPLIVVMLCAEYAYRQWRHAARPPERLIDMVRIVRQVRIAHAGERQ
jgi:uncharacterized membrane protein